MSRRSRFQVPGFKSSFAGARAGTCNVEPGTWNPRRGVTLIEMVTVIVILSLLLGLSIALFRNANRDLGVRASANHFVSLLRAVHDEARTRNSPAWIVIDVEENSCYAMTKETVGEWHFEDTVTTGAFGKNGRVTGGTLVPGRVGNAMQFSGSTTVECGEIPIYADDQGVVIEFWYYRTNLPARKQSLCAIGSQVELSVEASGRLTAKCGDVIFGSGDVTLRFTDRWYFIELVYDGREAQLFVNGALLGSKAGKMQWAKGQSLTIGAAKNGCTGILDEFRVSLLFPRERYVLPSESKWELPNGYVPAGKKEFVIHFDSEGRLDPRKHGQPLRFTIKSPSESREIILNLTGLVQR